MDLREPNQSRYLFLIDPLILLDLFQTQLNQVAILLLQQLDLRRLLIQ